LRFFAGVRAIHAHDRAEEIALGFFSSGQTVKADTVGAGPRAGMEFSARLGEQPVFLTGGIDGSVLFGRTEREWLFDTYGGTPPYVIAKSSDRATMYTLGGKLGVTWFASPGTSLTIGYQAEQVWRLRQAYSDLDAGDVGTIDGRGNNLVHGPFAKLGIYFDPVARPSAPTPTRWTGFRFGVDAGGGSVVAEAQNATLSMPPAAPQTFNGAGNLNGGLAGFHGGFDLQFGPLLAGLEGDVAWTNITGTGKISTVDSVTFGIDRLASLRGRAGVVYESALLYVTGGAAWSSVNSTLQAAGATASGRNDHEGWVAGAGLEYRLAPQWSARAEYLHYDLGTRSYALEAGGATYSADTNLKADVLRVGVSWIFAALP
jgi:outer membrane immunogenic protein